MHIKTPLSHIYSRLSACQWRMGKESNRKIKFPACPSLSYQSVICARRPPSSAVILRQHPGPQDAAGNTAGHRERCDNVTGYSRRGMLNTHLSVQMHKNLEYTHVHTMDTRAHRHTLKTETKTSTKTI